MHVLNTLVQNHIAWTNIDLIRLISYESLSMQWFQKARLSTCILIGTLTLHAYRSTLVAPYSINTPPLFPSPKILHLASSHEYHEHVLMLSVSVGNSVYSGL